MLIMAHLSLMLLAAGSPPASSPKTAPIDTARLAPVEWAVRCVEGPHAAWKKRMARSILEGTCYRAPMFTTPYSDKDYLDGATGGGPNGCTWHDPDGKSKPDLPLKTGMVAADHTYWPTGTCFYAPPPWNRIWVVADSGPGVRGKRHLDVYCEDTAEWREYARYTEDGSDLTVWVLGRVKYSEVREWAE